MPRLEAGALQLPQRYLSMVKAVLQAQLPGVEVWAYGSRVNGDCYEASDLDLVAHHGGDMSALWRAQEAFMDSDLPIQVQLVDWARIPVAFHAEIEAGYVVVQEAN